MPDGLAIENPALLALLIHEDIYVRVDQTIPLPGPEAPASQREVRPILVLHDAPLTPELTDLLYKILGAVKLAPSDIELCLTASYKKAATEGRRFIFLFSQEELRDFAFGEKYTAWPVAGGGQLIAADSLAVLAQSPPKKKQLWEVLKKAFGQ
jgi:DNA polymerase III psi subunit